MSMNDVFKACWHLLKFGSMLVVLFTKAIALEITYQLLLDKFSLLTKNVLFFPHSMII